MDAVLKPLAVPDVDANAFDPKTAYVSVPGLVWGGNAPHGTVSDREVPAGLTGRTASMATLRRCNSAWGSNNSPGTEVSESVDAQSPSAPAGRHKEMARMAGVIRRLKAGKIPQAGWIAANVPAAPNYVANLPRGDDVADFSPGVVAGVLTQNTAFYAGAGLPINALPAAAGGAAPVSDSSQAQLMTSGDAQVRHPEVDHSVPFSQWGSNDPRNARVLSYQENRNNIPARPPNSDIIALENDPFPINGHLIHRGDILSLGDVNDVLQQRAQVAPVASIANVNSDVMHTIYFEEPPRRGPKRRH